MIMIRVLMNGIAGHMGQTILKVANETSDVRIVAGVDRFIPEGSTIPCYFSLADVNEEYDVLIDFSVAAATDALLDYLESHPAAAVIGTTGLNDRQIARIVALSEKMPMFRTGNMSLGINLMTELVTNAASVLGSAFDVEITETHHRLKKDAPSGTALMLGNAVCKGLGTSPDSVYGRSTETGARTDHEIGFHSLRGGTVVGEHTVSFFGNDEVIEITHKAFSKRVFAEGALEAARFLSAMTNGLYDMTSVFAAK